MSNLLNLSSTSIAPSDSVPESCSSIYTRTMEWERDNFVFYFFPRKWIIQRMKYDNFPRLGITSITLDPHMHAYDIIRPPCMHYCVHITNVNNEYRNLINYMVRTFSWTLLPSVSASVRNLCDKYLSILLFPRIEKGATIWTKSRQYTVASKIHPIETSELFGECSAHSGTRCYRVCSLQKAPKIGIVWAFVFVQYGKNVLQQYVIDWSGVYYIDGAAQTVHRE